MLIILGHDASGMPLAGRCTVLNLAQRIRLLNQSGETVTMAFAGFQINLVAGTEVLLDQPVGQYLASGVHHLPLGPELWVKAAEGPGLPVATMPGPLGTYANLEVGYSLTLPPGWNVDEHGLVTSSKEVLFLPGDAEPFLAYLSILLDPRALDQIAEVYARDVPEAVREDTILGGLPAVRYTYPSGRQEYFIPHEGRMFLVSTDRPADGNVQQAMQSIAFASPSFTRYTNRDLGYSLAVPRNWVVAEDGLAAPNKEVRIYPENTEPFLAYLDIGLDPRSLETIKGQAVLNAQKADIFYAEAAGVQYLYASGRSEIYLDYHGQVYYLFSDRPADDNVQRMIDSWMFIAP